MLGARKQKAWLSDQSFAKKFGFETVDTAGEYELLAVRFDEAAAPHFTQEARRQTLDDPSLTVFYTDQCPFIEQRVRKLREFCQAQQIPASFVHADTLQKAKSLPCPFNNWAVFYAGRFVTVNQLDAAGVQKLIARGGA